MSEKVRPHGNVVHPAPSAPPAYQSADNTPAGAPGLFPYQSQPPQIGFQQQHGQLQAGPSSSTFGHQQHGYDEKQPGGPPMMPQPIIQHQMMPQPMAPQPMTQQLTPGMQQAYPLAPSALTGSASQDMTLDPSAPPLPSLDTMQKITGYQNVGYDDTSFVPPPPTYEEATGHQINRNFDDIVPKFDEAELRAALLLFVAEQSCYGKSAAEKLRFTELQHNCAYHYTLESFTEQRSNSWANMPFTGQLVDGPQNGVAPQPWQIPIQTPELFVDYIYLVMVPHTSFVHTCYFCFGNGKITCPECSGRGTVTCGWCRGWGTTGSGDSKRSCSSCNGRGRKRCPRCSGMCMVTCTKCKGNKRLLWYIQMKSLWKKHELDHVLLHTDLPNHLIRNVPGETIFNEQHPKLMPLTRFPNEEVNEVSKSLVHKHDTELASQRLHMQRHSIRVIPVTQAMYSWKDKGSDFFVYGLQKKVYAPNYPQQCCWGCTIV